MSEEEKGFVIKDRRRFDAEGQVKEEEPEKEAPKAESGDERAAQEKPQTDEAGKHSRGSEAPLPEINFSTFIFSLSTSALMHLGELPDPSTNAKATDLPLAKQTIDILGMLHRKTLGNLEEDEKNLLENLLTDLRLKYVSKKK